MTPAHQLYVFDATPNGEGNHYSTPDGDPDLLGIPIDWSSKMKTVKFSAPKKASSSELSCIARASGEFRITLRGGKIERMVHTKGDYHTLFICLPIGPVVKKGKKSVNLIGGDLKKFVDALDRHVIETAKGKVDEWFNRSMSGDLIEEYYRGSTTSTPSLRFVISAEGESDSCLAPGATANVTLQLIGVQFRSQYFTCNWKILRAEAAKEDEVRGFGFFPDDEEDPEEDLEPLLEEDDDVAYPTEEERMEMIKSEVERLDLLTAQWVEKVVELEEKVKGAREIREKLVESSRDAVKFSEAVVEADNFR